MPTLPHIPAGRWNIDSHVEQRHRRWYFRSEHSIQYALKRKLLKEELLGQKITISDTNNSNVQCLILAAECPRIVLLQSTWCNLQKTCTSNMLFSNKNILVTSGQDDRIAVYTAKGLRSSVCLSGTILTFWETAPQQVRMLLLWKSKQDATVLQWDGAVYLLKPTGPLGADGSRPTSASCT